MWTSNLVYDALTITKLSKLLANIFAFIIRLKNFNAHRELSLYKGDKFLKKMVGHLSYISTHKPKRPLYNHQ
jgi:hypothetical protein